MREVVLTYEEIFEFLIRVKNIDFFAYSGNLIIFVEKLLERRSFQSMLDMNSFGVMPISLQKTRDIMNVKLSQQNPNIRNATDAFLEMQNFKNYGWIEEHPMNSWELEQNFELIFSASPMNVRGHESVQLTEAEGNIIPLQDSQDIYLYNAIKHLKPNGTLLSLYPTGRFERIIKKDSHLLRHLATFDCALKAIFSFSSGVYSNTRIPMLLLKIEKAVPQGLVFLAEVDDQVDTTLQNYAHRKYGDLKDHGYWIPIEQYQNLRRLKLKDQFNTDFRPFVKEDYSNVIVR